ncbi:MAG: acyl-CoA dehydrogenase family protein, partial [Deltaproteobacteria bacterium]|nr:acyl-CoA dehydrogenase family protein [Deltaproteobacteria bacterium]
MDFTLTAEQQAYVDTVQRFVRQEITPQVMALEKSHAFPWEILRKAWEVGILNLSIPQSIRGFEVDVISTALIIEAL